MQFANVQTKYWHHYHFIIGHIQGKMWLFFELKEQLCTTMQQLGIVTYILLSCVINVITILVQSV